MEDTANTDLKKNSAGIDLLEEFSRLVNELAAMHRELAKKNVELAQERRNLLNLFDALPEFVCLLAPDYSIRYANETFKRLFGDPAGRPCYECMRKRQAPCETCPTLKVFKTGETQSWEANIKNGKHYMIHDVPFADKDGSMLAVEIGFDITRRKQAEDALRASARILSEVQQKAHIATGTLDITTGDMQWSDEIYSILGLPKGSPLSFEEYTQHIHPDDFQKIQDMWKDPDAKHASLEFEYRLIRPSGELRHVLEYTVYQYDENGSIISLATMLLDITERKLSEDALNTELAERRRVEAALHETELILSEAQQIAHLGTWTFNTSTGEFWWSDEIYHIFGVPVGGPMSYADFMQHVHPEDYQELIQAWSNMKDEKASIDYVYRIVRPGGEIRFIHEYSIYKYDGNGRTLISAGLLLDITERRRAEAALREKNAELERFAYTVSHDLRSPLVTIKTFMRYLAEDMKSNDSEAIAGDMDLINTAAGKMEELLAELLELSRIGRVVNPSVTTPLRGIAQEALALVAGRIAQRGALVQVADEPAELFGDRVRLVEVFQNLVDNAVKFMGEQPRPLVEIGANTEKGEIVCFVRDNGMGIDPRHRDRLFGLFEKLDPATEGSGMGLALVKRIVEVHGGRIWVESEGVGKGSCFYFTLPRKSSES